MILVLPGALPPASIAAGLVRHLPERAPTLAGWLGAAPAGLRELPVAEHACTPLQAWLLERAGYTPPPGVPLGAGWAVLEADLVSSADDQAPVWLADLAHLHVTHQGVTLLEPAALQLDDGEAGRLMDAAQPLLGESGIATRLLAPARLRLTLPEGLCPYAPTPQAAAGHEIQTWWSQDPATRPWRRVLNMVQMAWHEHPVNLARAERGLPSVNALWLFGGGRHADFTAQTALAQREGSALAPVIDDALAAPARAGDWSQWLQALARLERERFAPLQARLASSPAAQAGLRLVLTGDERLATLVIEPPRGLRRWLRRRPNDWRAWFAA